MDTYLREEKERGKSFNYDEKDCLVSLSTCMYSTPLASSPGSPIFSTHARKGTLKNWEEPGDEASTPPVQYVSDIL